MNYRYYEYHNSCIDCKLSLFLNVISPSMGDVDLFVSFSPDQNHLSLPSLEDSPFYSNALSSDVLIITPKNLTDNYELSNGDMRGYYLIAVMGTYGDNIHYSLRLSTQTD